MKSKLIEPRAGDRNYSFGGHIWRVLEVRDNKALLLREEIWDCRPYHRQSEVVTWAECTLRGELKSDFYDKIPQPDRERIELTHVTNSGNLWYGTDGENDTQDYVFLLSSEEVIQYFGSDQDRVAIHNGKALWWWLRSPGYDYVIMVSVGTDGRVRVPGAAVYNAGGVRPALWLNL